MKKIRQKRFYVLYGITGFFAIVIFARLYMMQVVGGEAARNIMDSRLSLSAVVPARRGEITDRYGKVLAKSKTGYSVVIEKKAISKEEQKQAILRAFLLLSEEEMQNYTDIIPISFHVPYVYEGTKPKQSFCKEFGFSEQMPAEEMIHALCRIYEIGDDLSAYEKRLLCGVYAGMQAEGFSFTQPYTIAGNISTETVTRIKEQADDIPSITIQKQYMREYLYPETAVHMLGRVGKISREEYEEKREQGYKRTDEIGKQGAEKFFEEDLRGTDGIQAVFDHTDYITPKEAVEGNIVVLTLDLDLQKKTEKALKDAVSRTYRSERNGAAAVVIDVHSGDILASASYPAYDVTTFHSSYTALQNNPAKPMFHRSLAGLYAPGSTFKPISAIAAIENGSMLPGEKMETKGEYAYLDRVFRCNIFRTKGETHGYINMPEAIGLSCNYYFYELGRRTGIEAIAETAKAFGLGGVTGSDTKSEEARGKIASPETREQNGGVWYPGDVLQAAIGQSDHLFTPIQLANYAAALANGGTLYKTRLKKTVLSGTDGNILYRAKPEVVRKIQLSETSILAVKEGMRLVTADGGTAGEIFRDFPIEVAGKTGSAQVSSGTNALFIGYAPADQPQIAISVVVENGGVGVLAANVAKDIFKAYFEKPAFSVKQEVVPYTIQP